MCIFYDLAVPPLGIPPVEIHTYVHRNSGAKKNVQSSTICNSFQTGNSSTSINSGMDEHIAGHSGNRILHSNEKEEILLRVAAWMNVKNKTLHKGDQTQKRAYHKIPT